ncbi:MAG: hypothetical protein ACUVWX_08715 [Kiritimatiellia bacterium]
MAEDLQGLLEKIRKDGVEKAEEEAHAIVEAARQEADRIVAEAQSKAREVLEAAQKESSLLVQRGKVSLTQAGRDVILSVGLALNRTLEALVHDHVKRELRAETLRTILVRAVETYCGDQATRSEVLVPPELEEEIRNYFMTAFAKQMAEGLEVRGDRSVVAGFRIMLREGKVEYDFSAEAIAAALCQVLRPHLAEIVRNSLTQEIGGTKKPDES